MPMGSSAGYGMLGDISLGVPGFAGGTITAPTALNSDTPDNGPYTNTPKDIAQPLVDLTPLTKPAVIVCIIAVALAVYLIARK